MLRPFHKPRFLSSFQKMMLGHRESNAVRLGISEQAARVLHDLGPGDVAIDCGANVGHVTEVMAANGATVYAFEPNPHAFDALRQRFSKTDNVRLLNKGVLDESTIVPLYMHENAERDPVHWSTGSSLLATKRNVNPAHAVDVEVVDLAEFISSLRRKVQVLKMDIEGAEIRVLRHLIATNSISSIERVFVEQHTEKMPELRAEQQQLEALIQQRGITNIDFSWI